MSAEIFRPVDIYLAIQKPESLHLHIVKSTFQEWRQMLMSEKIISTMFFLVNTSNTWIFIFTSQRFIYKEIAFLSQTSSYFVQ